MKLEKLIIFIVISLIMVVAAFNIISSLIRMIIEKRREIGILMSMGTSSGDILKIFMLYGTIIGLVGSTFGTGLGIMMSYIQYRWHLIPLPGDIYFINTLPVLLKPTDIAAVYCVANFICVLAAIYPAWRASRLPPADSIRYE
jgi:lipoprotein-releasing system permease protein